MATLTAQNISRSGITPTYASAAGGGDEFVNTGNEVIHVKNGDSGAHVVTIVSQAVNDGLALADRTLSVGAGSEKICGPFPTAVYNDANGKVQLTYDGVTGVTIAVLKQGS